MGWKLKCLSSLNLFLIHRWIFSIQKNHDSHLWWDRCPCVSSKVAGFWNGFMKFVTISIWSGWNVHKSNRFKLSHSIKIAKHGTKIPKEFQSKYLMRFFSLTKYVECRKSKRRFIQGSVSYNKFFFYVPTSILLFDKEKNASP